VLQHSADLKTITLLCCIEKNLLERLLVTSVTAGYQQQDAECEEISHEG
jgi:hypothetical protein